VLTCDLYGDQLTSSNPSQTAGNHLGKDDKVGGCKELKLTEREQQGVQLCPIAARLNFWVRPAATSAFPAMASVAMRLNSMNTTSCASERSWSLWGQLCTKARNRLVIERDIKACFHQVEFARREVLPA
jgi:hypothetical protein